MGKLSSGMSILALVGITFHPQYGLSLNIIDIDPNYSLGEIARLRLETIQRLKRNGLFTMNKELDLPFPPAAYRYHLVSHGSRLWGLHASAP